MNYLNKVLYMYNNLGSNSKLLLGLICVTIFLLFIILIVSLFKGNNTSKNYEIKKDIKPKERKINTINFEDDNIFENKKEEIKEEPKKIEIPEEKEEIEVIEVMEENTDDELENIKKLIEENIENQEPINLNEFEREQEKSAIISYDELVKKAGAKKIVYKTKKEEKENNISNTRTFRPSEIISPVYGTRKEKRVSDEVDKSFEEVEKMKYRLTRSNEEEMKDDLEFLGNLKKFRSSLDL